MKSAKEILDKTIVSGFIKNNTLEQSVIEAMKEYAEQALDEASKVAIADVTFGGNLAELDSHDSFIYGEDFEVYVINSSILDVKKLLK